MPARPRLAAFPKAYMDELCVTRTLTLPQWVDMAATLGVDGLEMYTGFFHDPTPAELRDLRAQIADHGLVVPMLCASPDFTRRDPAARQREIEKQRAAIDLIASFDAPGTRTCRVLSGQRRPEIGIAEGVQLVVACIEQLLPYAAERNVVLVIENHYKDNYWTHPEFAQHLAVFRQIVETIDSPWFGVNYDPSNALLAGEEPLDVLDAVKHRIVCMHASDRGLVPGATLDDLRRQEDAPGYAGILRHGEIGTGLNDYPAIFRTLHSVGFGGWVSIEDGVNGMDELQRSVAFLRAQIAAVWGGQ